MLLVVPVSLHDRKLIPYFVASIKRFAFSSKHNLLIVSNPNASLYATILYEYLKGFFCKSDIYIFYENAPSNWPLGPNWYFANTVEYLRSSKNKMPWMWCELDCTPIKDNWLDALQADYTISKKPFMGVVRKWQKYTSRGFLDFPYLVGTAIYPANACDYIADPFSPVNAFDVYFGNYTAPNTHKTALIQHDYRSNSYKLTDDRVTGLRKCFKTSKTYSCSLDAQSVLHHGCVDGSLAECISDVHKYKLPDYIPVFFAVPKCGTSYTRYSIDLILFTYELSQNIDKVNVFLKKQDKHPAATFYFKTNNTTQTSDITVNQLTQIGFSNVVCAIFTSMSLRYDKSLYLELERRCNKQVKPFSVLREPNSRLNSLVNYLSMSDISNVEKNWATKFLYFLLTGYQVDVAQQEHVDYLKGLLKENKLILSRFPNINNVLANIFDFTLPLHFGNAPSFKTAYNKQKDYSAKEYNKFSHRYDQQLYDASILFS
jgi:hypothetical protein